MNHLIMLAILEAPTAQFNEPRLYKNIYNSHNKYETTSLKRVNYKYSNSKKYNKNPNHSPSQMRHTRKLRW
jgi:hypothetical protein